MHAAAYRYSDYKDLAGKLETQAPLSQGVFKLSWCFELPEYREPEVHNFEYVSVRVGSSKARAAIVQVYVPFLLQAVRPVDLGSR